MELKQNDLEYLMDQVQLGKMTANQANVEKVRMQRVLLVTARLTRDVRNALMVAVKTGYLGHVKKDKDNHLPETFYHPEFDYLVAGERNAHQRKIIEAVKRYVTG